MPLTGPFDSANLEKLTKHVSDALESEAKGVLVDYLNAAISPYPNDAELQRLKLEHSALVEAHSALAYGYATDFDVYLGIPCVRQCVVNALGRSGEPPPVI